MGSCKGPEPENQIALRETVSLNATSAYKRTVDQYFINFSRAGSHATTLSLLLPFLCCRGSRRRTKDRNDELYHAIPFGLTSTLLASPLLCVVIVNGLIPFCAGSSSLALCFTPLNRWAALKTLLSGVMLSWSPLDFRVYFSITHPPPPLFQNGSFAASPPQTDKRDGKCHQSGEYYHIWSPKESGKLHRLADNIHSSQHPPLIKTKFSGSYRSTEGPFHGETSIRRLFGRWCGAHVCVCVCVCVFVCALGGDDTPVRCSTSVIWVCWH